MIAATSVGSKVGSSTRSAPAGRASMEMLQHPLGGYLGDRGVGVMSVAT